MAFPEEAFDAATGTIRADHDVFAYGPDSNRVPRYITWDAELQHAMADRAFILNQLLVRTETSPEDTLALVFDNAGHQCRGPTRRCDA